MYAMASKHCRVIHRPEEPSKNCFPQKISLISPPGHCGGGSSYRDVIDSPKDAVKKKEKTAPEMHSGIAGESNLSSKTSVWRLFGISYNYAAPFSPSVPNNTTDVRAVVMVCMYLLSHCSCRSYNKHGLF